MDDKVTRQSHPTRFDLRRPCPDCPFTRTAPGYLSEDRAQEITDAILFGNNSFACHETLDYDCTEEEGEGIEEDEIDDPGITSKSCWCAGALTFYAKLEGRTVHHANGMIQIAERLGWYDSSRLDPSALERVFNTQEEMVEHHRTRAIPVKLSAKKGVNEDEQPGLATSEASLHIPQEDGGMSVKPDELARGHIVFVWHDTGAFGVTPMYAEIVRVNRVTATLKWLSSGLQRRVRFVELHSVAPQDWEQIRREEIRENR